MDNIREQRHVIESFCKIVDQASFVLKENPELLFLQVYNRLQWQAEQGSLLETMLKSAREGFRKPFFRLLSKPGNGHSFIRVFTGHTDAVTLCAFSPDGKRIVSASEDGSFRIWHVDSGKELVSHTHAPVNLGYDNLGRIVRPKCIFSPDGKSFVLVTGQKTVSLRNVDSGSEVVAFIGHTDCVRGGAFSPDGTQLLTVSEDKTHRLWDVQTGKEIKVYENSWKEGIDCAITPDGMRVVSAFSGVPEIAVVLWDIENGKTIRSVTKDGSLVTSCAFSPSGNRIYVVRDNRFHVWDSLFSQELVTIYKEELPSRKPRVTQKNEFRSEWEDAFEEWFLAARVTTTEKFWLLSVTKDGTIRMWDVETMEELVSFEGHAGEVLGCDFSPDGRFLVSASEDRTLRLWNTEARGKSSDYPFHTKAVNDCAFSSDGSRVVSAGNDGFIKLWDAENSEKLTDFEADHSEVYSCSFNPAGSRIAVGDSDGGHMSSMTSNSLMVWDVRRWKKLASLSLTAPVKFCAFSPDGKQIVCNSKDGNLMFWGSRIFHGNMDKLRYISCHSYVSACAFSPDGRFFATAGSDDVAEGFEVNIKLWNFVRYTPLEILKMSTDLGSYQPLATLRGHTRIVKDLAFSPDGRFLVSASIDRTLKMWDVEKGVCLRTYSGHMEEVNSCAFSPDGRYILSASEDMTLRLWDAVTGDEITVFKGFSGSVNTCAFSPDGQRMVLGDSQGKILFVAVDRIAQLPIIVTPLKKRLGLQFRCPGCLKHKSIRKSFLGSEITCSNCGQKLKLNQFFL